MPANQATFLNDFAAFTDTSLTWCAKESEAEVTNIFQSLQAMVADIKRRSAMSAGALNAVQELQEAIRGSSGGADVKALLTVLKRFSQDNTEIADLTSPVIEALQFQDRLRQNLENAGKLIKAWVATRERLVAAGKVPEEALPELGQTFLKCMTSLEERDVVRKYIDGLPVETKVAEPMLF